MKTRLTLELVVEHPTDWNPVDHFVYYFDDMPDGEDDFTAHDESVFVDVEEWVEVTP